MNNPFQISNKRLLMNFLSWCILGHAKYSLFVQRTHMQLLLYRDSDIFVISAC